MPLSFLSEFLMSGFVSVCTWWLNSGEPVTKDQLMEYFTDLARYLHV
ncbi:MAG: TetR family transcriptional regulator C-terminal domain-containing protein [Clostridia bacterium]|nr:TetR family transcriptional regulator C-terminal domain-containing protein [Clostridia bacterium]